MRENRTVLRLVKGLPKWFPSTEVFRHVTFFPMAEGLAYLKAKVQRLP